MSIQTTLGALVNAESALIRLNDLRLGYARMYQISKLTALVRAEAKFFYDKRAAAIKVLGAPRATATDDERAKFGDSLTEVPKEKQPEFFAKLAELEQVAVTIDWTPLAPADDLNLSGAEILALGALLAEPTP